jgi:hypothetical protein
MKTLFHRRKGPFRHVGITPSLRLLILVSAAWLQGADSLWAAPPAWWAARGVTVSGKAQDDYAVVNLGQLKNMATQARNEFNGFFSGGGGTAVNSLVDSWANPSNASDYAPCNLGQLKAVAKVFWDRWISATGTGSYPWTATTTDDDDFAPANLGQLKNVFSFDTSLDWDRDGIPDAWEMQQAGNLTTFGRVVDPPVGPMPPWGFLPMPGSDFDGDGITDAAEYAFGLNIRVADAGASTKEISYDNLGRIGSTGVSTYSFDEEGNLLSVNP